MKNEILQHLTRMSQIKTSVGTTVWSGYGTIECHTLLLTCKLMQPLQKPGRFFLFLFFFLQVEQLCCDSPVPLLGICSREMKTVSKQRLGQECHSSFTQNCHTLETTQVSTNRRRRKKLKAALVQFPHSIKNELV